MLAGITASLDTARSVKAPGLAAIKRGFLLTSGSYHHRDHHVRRHPYLYPYSHVPGLH